MFPKQLVDGFEKYWRRRKPGSSTALHYASDVRIFFKWLNGRTPESITESLGVEESGGMVRVGPVHYNTVKEIERFGEVLREIAAA
jgi:selenocysteine lyase/cysteine desulfurase